MNENTISNLNNQELDIWDEFLEILAAEVKSILIEDQTNE